MAVTSTTLRLQRAIRVRVDRTVNAAVRSLVAACARAWQEIAAEWVEAIDELITDADEHPTTPHVSIVMRASRARQALQIAVERLDELGDLTGVTVMSTVNDLLDNIGPEQARVIASQMPPPAGTQVDLAVRFDRVHPATLDAIVARTAQQVTSDRAPLTGAARDAMLRSLVRGVASGQNPRVAARQMLKRVQGDFNGGLTRALVIARTETLDAYRSGAAATHLANTDVLAGWQWVAKLDTRTCPSCWAMHGSIHPLEQPGPLDHHQGRCARVPVAKSWRQLGFAIDEPPSLVPDAREVFAQLPGDEQLAIMGPTRLAALNSGAASWSDLSQRRQTVGWRDSYAPRPARDFRRMLQHAV